MPDDADNFHAALPSGGGEAAAARLTTRCYSWDLALSFAPVFSTYGSAVNPLPYAAIGALRTALHGRRRPRLPVPPYAAGLADDTAEAVLLQRRGGILGGEGRSFLNEVAEPAPLSALMPLMRPSATRSATG